MADGDGAPWAPAEAPGLRVDALFVTISGAALEPCGASEVPQGYGALPGALSAVAWAHGEGGATALADPVVVDLLEGSQEALLGEWAPPPGRYCAVRIGLGAADADAAGLGEAPQLLGQSAAAQGQWRGAPLAWRTSAAFEVRRALSPPLTFGDDEDQRGRLRLRWRPQGSPPWADAALLEQAQRDGRLPDALLLALGEALEVEAPW